MKGPAARKHRKPTDDNKWFEARIVDALMEEPGQLKQNLKHSMKKDGFNITRLEKLFRVWHLRMRMLEHLQGVGSNTNGEPLTFEHFESALSFGKPDEMVRRAAREDLSVREIHKLREGERALSLLEEKESREYKERMDQKINDIMRQNYGRD